MAPENSRDVITPDGRRVSLALPVRPPTPAPFVPTVMLEENDRPAAGTDALGQVLDQKLQAVPRLPPVALERAAPGIQDVVAGRSGE